MAWPLTYLCSATGPFPACRPTNPDPRTTDDKFVMEITTEQNALSAEELEAAIKETQLFELSIKDYEE